MMIARPLAAALVCSATLASSPAQAAPNIGLSWNAPVSCPTESALLASLNEALTASTKTERLEVVAKVLEPLAPATHWTLNLTFSGKDMEGERRVEGASCEALAKSAVLVIAMTYDPVHFDPPSPSPAPSPTPSSPTPSPAPPTTTPAPSPSPTPPNPPPEPPRPEPSPPDPPPPESPPPVPEPPLDPPSPVPEPPPLPPSPIPALDFPPAATRPRLGIAVALLGDIGSLPRAAAGFRADVRARWPRWLLDVNVSYLPSVAGFVADSSVRGGDVDLWAVGVGGCGVPWTTRASEPAVGDMSLRLCVGGAGGEMRATGFGVAQPVYGSALWGAVYGGGGFDVSLAPWLAWVNDVEVGVPLSRPNFFLSNVGDVHAPAVAHGRLRSGLEATF